MTKAFCREVTLRPGLPIPEGWLDPAWDREVAEACENARTRDEYVAALVAAAERHGWQRPKVEAGRLNGLILTFSH